MWLVMNVGILLEIVSFNCDIENPEAQHKILNILSMYEAINITFSCNAQGEE